MAATVPKVLIIDIKAVGRVLDDGLYRRADVKLTSDLSLTTVGVRADPEVKVVVVCD